MNEPSNEEFEQRWRELSRGWYIFENGHIRPAKDIIEAAANLGDIEARRVDLTEISDNCHVSTVFLGLDHGFLENGPPVLFETMIFGGEYGSEDSQYTFRYTTYGQAKRGHWAVVEALKAGMEPKVPEGEETGWIWRQLFDMLEGKEGEEWKKGTEYDDN